MAERGTARAPGADPARMPVGLDLRAISLAEGVRAGLAAALPMAVAVWLRRPDFAMAALGALLTCICDPGGAMRRRAPLLIAFALAGAVFLGGFGLLRAAGILPVLAGAAVVLFLLSYMRVWGQAAVVMGNLLSIVVLLGCDRALGAGAALSIGLVFAAGSSWALLLTLVFWRLHPYGPARRAVAEAWLALADSARQMQRAASGDDPAGWERVARAARGGVRAAIERARETINATIATRGPITGASAQALMRLEAAEQIFAGLIALSDLLEEADAATRRAGVAFLRRLRPLLLVLGRAVLTDRVDRLPRLDAAIDAAQAACRGVPALAGAAGWIAERLRVAARLVDPELYLPGGGSQGETGIPFRTRLLAPLRANLSWRSASLRHAARVLALVLPALAWTLVFHTAYTHWLTITLVLVMQPSFAGTWQRALERVGGTLLGGAVAALLSALLTSPLLVAAALPAVSALALAVRQVSYAVYIAVYTPVIVLLVESFEPGTSEASIALARAGYTVLGGLLAVAGNALLWPSWELLQLETELRRAIAAHAEFAEAVLRGAAPEAVERTRRQAGLASNNLEAAISRAMQEPGRDRRRVDSVLVADATLRRIAGRLTAMAYGAGPAGGGPAAQWVLAALRALAAGEELPPGPPPAEPPLARLARQVTLLAAALGTAPGPRAAPAEGGRAPAPA